MTMDFPEPYTVVMASDVIRDGMGLELYLRGPAGYPDGDILMEVFYSDVDGTFQTQKFRSVPANIEEWFQAEARRRLPPMPS